MIQPGTTDAPVASEAREATIPPAVISYRPEIDGLRALAVLLVIGHHLGAESGILPSGFLGVDIFFVISGFVITASIQRHGAQPLRPFLLGFYRRRVQRLAPALVLCVAVTALLSCLVIPDPAPSLRTGAAALFGLSNLELHHQAGDYFGTDAALNTFTQTWSLGVEEQFYLGYPLLAWGLGLGRGGDQGRPRLFRLVLLLVVGLSLGWFLWLGSRNPGAAYLLTPGRLWELAAGALLVPLARGTVKPGISHQPPLRPRSLHLPAWLPLAALLLLPLAPQRAIAFTTPLAVAATVLLIPTAARPGAVQRLLRTPWIRHLGLISYSLYLWHWSVISLSRWTIGLHPWTMPLQLLAMLALAEASYRFVEQPLRRRPWARSDGQTVLRGVAVIGALSGLLAWLALGAGGRHLYAGERTATVREQLARQTVAGTAISNPRCHLDADDQRSRTAINQLARNCHAAARAGRPTLFVAGDSHASALMPLESDLHGLGYGIGHLSMNGCPFPATAYGTSKPGCRPFQRTWADWILASAHRGDAVLIAGYHLSHLGVGIGDTRDQLLGADGRPITSADGKLELYSEALRDFAARAQAKGVRVLLLGAGPRLLQRDTCLPEWFRPERWNNRCSDALQHQIGYARQLNQQLARRLPPTITLIDPEPIFCPEGCRLGAMRQVLFDSDHPTAASVRQLQPLILGFLASPPDPTGKQPRQTGPERNSP